MGERDEKIWSSPFIRPTSAQKVSHGLHLVTVSLENHSGCQEELLATVPAQRLYV